MSKQLYEEAIADVKKLKEIAEDNAKRAVVEAVAPRIRELIEKELLGESIDEMDEVDEVEAANKKGEVLTDEMVESEVTMSNEDMTFGEVDEMEAESSYESNESTFEEVHESIHEEGVDSNVVFERKLSYLKDIINSMRSIDNSLKETRAYSNKVAQLNSMVESLYGYVQDNVADPAKKLSCNLQIQNCLMKIERLQEKKMKRNNNRLDEESISLELTGLPDDIDLESLGVNLVSGEEEEGGEEGAEEEGGEEGAEEEGGEEGGEEELDLGGGEEGGEEELDLGGGEEGAEEEGGEEEEAAPKAESRRLSDNVIVEIDEGMLRREIARMKAIRETAVPSTKGSKPGPNEFDDFGGADSEGEPLEMSLREMEEMSGDDVVEIVEDDTYESEARTDSHASKNHREVAQSQKRPDSPQMESIRRRMAHELKLQESLKERARSAARLYEAAKEKFSKVRTLSERKEISRRGSAHKASYTNFAKRYNESVKRFNQLSKSLAEAKALQSRRSNSVAKKPAASSGESVQLRNKLAETNLLNAKLVFTNKLLQSEALTARQKSQVIAQLDEAKTLREVKLVYESLAKTLAAPRKPVTESRVLGSSSQATRSASAQTLNEGFESERWAKLAGIAK